MPKSLSVILHLIIIGLISCKKEKDTNAPSIHIHQPADGASYFYFSLIPVGAHIKDDKTIERVEIEVTDQLNRKYLLTDPVFPGSKDYELSISIPHDDLYLESGTYFIRITADDGENRTTAYREIQLFEAPRQLLKTMAIRPNGSITSVDSVGVNSVWPWFNMDGFDHCGINSRTKELVVSDNLQHHISVYDLADQIPLPQTTFDIISGATTSAYALDEELREFYFGMSNGEIVKFGQTGFQLMGNITGETTRNMLITEHWIYTITSPLLFPAQSQINVWNKQTGSFVQSQPVGFEVFGLAEAESEEEIFIAGNGSDESVFRKYFKSSNGINDVFSFYETSPMVGFAIGEEDNFYVIHESGVAFYVNDMQSYQLNSSISPLSIFFEQLGSRVFLLEPNGVRIMNESCTAQLNYIAGDDYSDVLFLYNK